MAKQLRLDVAQLTDVGRKREHNEDNMAYVIPKDPQVMARKGALFIVADGMGGHAAGEVASEIAVDTVSNLYYQEDSDDIAVSLQLAIKRANAAIHQRAAENMLRSGMGTTCVAAALHGNMAYIANVGDSRAYIVRSSKARQVSQDHSWVAEQVRAGLLTEDQARIHAQRNVITRCLGTQTDVEIDVFSEQLEEGDALVLCTDGLSGLISDDDLQRIVNQFVPQESVYHLVERANENGGPDNITAIVVRVQEVDSDGANGRYPVPVGGVETSQDGRITASLSTMPMAFAPAASGEPLRIPSGPLVSPDIDTAPQPIVQAPRQKRGRLFYPTLALVVLLVMTVVGGGAYYLLGSGPNVGQSLQQAHSLIIQANGEVSSNPVLALQHFSSAQKTLQGVQTSSQLTPAQRSQLGQLMGDLTIGVKTAISSYNQHTGIIALPCSTASSIGPINDGSTGTHAQRIAFVQATPPALYASGQDSKLYQLKNSNGQSSLVSPFALPAGMQVVDIASDGALLAVLMKATNSETYRLGLLMGGQSQFKSVISILPAGSNQKPTLVVVQGMDVYVVFASAPAANSAQNAQLLDFTFMSDTKGDLTQKSTGTSLSVSSTIVSVAALPGHVLLLLLANGTVQSLKLSGISVSPTPVLVQLPIALPLAANAADFTAMTAVPVASAVAQTGPLPLFTSGVGALSAGLVGSVPHLYIADPGSHRILDLMLATNVPIPAATGTGGGVVSGTNLTFQLVRQYVFSSGLGQIMSVTVDVNTMIAFVLSQNSASLFSLVGIVMAAQPPGACV